MPLMHRVCSGLLIALMSCAAVPAQACSIPVFRYALERWTPSLYDIVIFRHGDFSREQLTMLESIGRRQANAEIRSVDLAGKVDDDDLELWKAQEKTGDLPAAKRHALLALEQTPRYRAAHQRLLAIVRKMEQNEQVPSANDRKEPQ